MTQEDKNLLLQDLCARLPYGVKVQTTYINQKTKKRSDIGTDILHTVEISMLMEGFEEHKPYLFPLSSMTEEQKDVYHSFYADILRGLITSANSVKMIDWLNKNHFDFRNLIGRGLAIDCTNLNIY